MGWYLAVLKKYAVFSGRARRKEYWMFVLINFVFALGCGMIDQVAGFMAASGWGLMSALYNLAVLIPSFAVTVRRLHDVNRSGWWTLSPAFPALGLGIVVGMGQSGSWMMPAMTVGTMALVIVLFIFLVRDSDPGENSYGQNPKMAMG